MYEIALSVGACVRSNTRADIVWLISPDPRNDANAPTFLALTPGGGKIGDLFDGAFDSHFYDVATKKLTSGRILDITVSPLESALSGLEIGTKLKFGIAPTTLFEADLWPALNERQTIAIVSKISGDEIVATELFTDATILAAESDVSELFASGAIESTDLGEKIITIYRPVIQFIISGQGPIAEAIAAGARRLGWKAQVTNRNDIFAGFTARLSPMDGILVMGHEVEISGRALAYALESSAGYIGAMGSAKMQEQRADWLAYQEITDLSRIYGPAGFNIGAKGPEEIAVSVLAEAISVLNGI